MTSTMVIGHTGFIGSTFIRQARPQTLIGINSKNLSTLTDQAPAHLLCTGVTAHDLTAHSNSHHDPHNDPTGDTDGDLDRIDTLFDRLEGVRARTATLISTIDVYGPTDRYATENDTPCPADTYGANHLHAEQRFARIFPIHRILRLPALLGDGQFGQAQFGDGQFGDGLRPNTLRALLDDEGPDYPRLAAIDPLATVQWYDADRIAQDVSYAWFQPARLLNMATPPISIDSIARTFFADRRDRIGAGLSSRSSLGTTAEESAGGSAEGSAKWRSVTAAEVILAGETMTLAKPHAGRVPRHGAVSGRRPTAGAALHFDVRTTHADIWRSETRENLTPEHLYIEAAEKTRERLATLVLRQLRARGRVEPDQALVSAFIKEA